MISAKRLKQNKTSLLSLLVVGAALAAFAILPVMSGMAAASKGDDDHGYKDYDHKKKFHWCYEWYYSHHHYYKHWYKDFYPYEDWYDCHPPMPHYHHDDDSHHSGGYDDHQQKKY